MSEVLSVMVMRTAAVPTFSRVMLAPGTTAPVGSKTVPRSDVFAWAHTTEMAAHGYLPYALSQFGLMPPRSAPPTRDHEGRAPGRILT